jgi:hypothetical protein
MGEYRRRPIGVGVGEPTRGRGADRDPDRRARDRREPVGERRLRDDRLDSGALDAIGELLGAQQRRRGNDHRPELDRREHRLPQGDDVAEHDEHAIAATDPERGEVIGDARGAFREVAVAEAQIPAVVIDDPQRGVVGAPRERIEVVDRPVEVLESRPREIARRRVGRGRGAQQCVPRGPESVRLPHRVSLGGNLECIH